MHTYLIRRLLLVIVTLFMVSLIVFAVVRLLPVDVIDAMAAEVVGGGTAGAEVFDRAALEKALGLDVPMHVQYGRWLTGIVLRGSLGDSLRSHLPVTQMIGSRIGVTFELGFLAVVMSLLISLPIGNLLGGTPGHRRRLRGTQRGDRVHRRAELLGGDAGGALPRDLVGVVAQPAVGALPGGSARQPRHVHRPGVHPGDGDGRHHHAHDTRHDVGGIAPGLYQDGVVEGGCGNAR